LENGLPSFWNSKLSRLFAVASSPSPARSPKRVTREQKKQRARDLRSQGASIKEISRALGVSVGTVYNYLKDYPYGKNPGV
jgi:DNA invertase Pin-like site-specific DNA recombinase